jgi:hypothetical protein
VAKYEAAIKEVDVKLSVSGGDSGSKGPKKQKTEITIYTLRNGVVRAHLRCSFLHLACPTCQSFDFNFLHACMAP